MNSAAIARAYYAQREQNELRRWLVASGVVVAAHVFAVLAVLYWPKAIQSPSDAPPAVIVELAPIAVAPDARTPDVAPGPEMLQAQPKQQQEKKAEEKLQAPEAPEKPSEVELPPSAPEKQEQQKQDAQKAKQQQKDQQQKAAPETTAQPKLNLQKSNRQAAPAAGSTAESQAAIANWRGAVFAHIARFKRSSPGATGTATVTFLVDAGGRVISTRLAASSGNGGLDADAVAMVVRASPVPRPPADLSRGGNVSVTVPVRYLR